MSDFYVNHTKLINLCHKAFKAAGMPDEDAAYSANCIVQTNLCGVDSHGVLRLPAYVTRLQKKAVNPTPNMNFSVDMPAIAMLNADNALGYVAGHKAMSKAVEMAKKNGIGCVVVNNSNHFGAAAIFAKEAAEKGMIGLAMTTVIPNMVAPGGSKPIAGNNPIAMAAPLPGGNFVFDLSLSQVAGGKLLLATEKGEKIPLDWAVDKDGNPTDDPKAGFAGFLLPVGGHKGFVLSLAVDILAGVLSNSLFSMDMKSMYAHPDEGSGTGHFMLAINPSAFMPMKEWNERMQSLHGYVKNSSRRPGCEPLAFPGEIEQACAENRLHTGIPIPEKLHQQLKDMIAEYKLDCEL